MKLKIDYFSKTMLTLLLAMAVSSFGFGQRAITGTVTDAENGEPLIGANILVVGMGSGTITDIDGSYSLNLPEGATELEFSYTGYATQRIAVGASDVIDLALSPGSVLDEVVVVGYGTQKTKEITSAVSSVKAEDFNNGNVNSISQLVQGKVAGLSISQAGGDPNGSATLRLRGLSTLGQNTEPLVIIDGVIGASLETVDPNDIESIDVLKDGSAGAIYGTRASSGVIIVTTKKGQEGRTSVDYNGYITTESIARRVPTTSASEFAELRPNQDQGADTDWIDEVTRNAISHVHNLSMSGGFGNTTYRASVNFRDIDGVSNVSGFQQLNGRLNLSQKALDDRLTLSMNIATTERTSNFGFNEAFRYATTYNPTAPVFLNEGDPLFDKYGGYYQAENFDYFNPVAILDQGQNVGELKDLLISLRGDLEIVDGLVGSVAYSLQRESDIFGEYYNKTAYFRGFNRNGLAKQFTEDRNTELFEVTGRYSKVFGKLDFTALAGYSYQDFGKRNFEVESGDFISDEFAFNAFDFSLNPKQSGGLTTINSFREEYKVIAFFGRLNFNIDDTYYLQLTARQEGSTRFGADNKWSDTPFFGASAGVTISNLVDIASVDNLKLRIAYGQTGNLPGESYLSQQVFEPQGSFFFNGEFVPAIGPIRNANPALRWETKNELNAGLDFALFDYKLTGTVDYYTRTTEDLIYQVVVPVPPNLADRTWANLDDVVLRNSGVEVSLGSSVGNENFTWEPNVVFSTYNTILDTVEVDDANFEFFQSGNAFFDFNTSPGAPGLNNAPTIAVFGGEELGQIWGPEFVEVGEDGTFVFADQNGDGTTDADGDGVTDEEDKIVIGNALPDFSIGFANTFRFGDFDLNFFIRGDFGHDLANFYRAFYEPLGTGSREIENIVKTEFFDENLKDSPEFSSYYVEDASYVALDNATLGYTLNFDNNSYIKRMRLYVTGQNLVFLTGYSGVDPSPRYADPGSADNGGRPSREFNADPLAPGLDRRSRYFLTRSFTFGVNLGF
jgi:TonB-linked SusC/RagA family outer membrane protein